MKNKKIKFKVKKTYTFKKLNFLYTIHNTYTAGLVLEGWEVKSLLESADINNSFCVLSKDEKFLHLKNCKIVPMHNHILDDSIENKQTRDRILLLNKSELNKIKQKLYIKGYTCVPIKLYQNDSNKWKIDIALVSGKNTYDKKQDIKSRDIDRDSRKQLKDI